MDSYTGEVRVFPFPYTPWGWAYCDGSMLPVSQHAALFSLIGTTFGGDGMTTIGLPNLNGRTVMGTGQGPGLSYRQQGDMGGHNAVTLTDSQMPVHSHTARAMAVPASTPTPSDQVLLSVAVLGRPFPIYNPDPEVNANMSVMATTVAGQSQMHENRQPYVTISYYISLYGEYPPRP